MAHMTSRREAAGMTDSSYKPQVVRLEGSGAVLAEGVAKQRAHRTRYKSHPYTDCVCPNRAAPNATLPTNRREVRSHDTSPGAATGHAGQRRATPTPRPRAPTRNARSNTEHEASVPSGRRAARHALVPSATAAASSRARLMTSAIEAKFGALSLKAGMVMERPTSPRMATFR